MKVLLVEDKLEIREKLEAELPASIDITHVESAEEAIEVLEADLFDLAVCDLKIPASATLLEPHVEHGLHVFDRIRADHPGMPIIVYSAFGVLKDLGDRLADAPLHDLFGDGPTRHVAHREKNKPELLIQSLLDFQEKLSDLEDIEISPATSREYLDGYSRRLLRIYAKQQGGVLVKVARLAGGRSSAVTVRAEIDTSEGPLGGAVVAKMDNQDAIAGEEERLRRYLGPLGAGSYTPLVDAITAGAANRAALFYALASKFDRSLFDVLSADPHEAARTVQSLAETMRPWHAASSEKSMQLKNIRSRLLSGDHISRLSEESRSLLAEVDEDQNVHVNWSTGHGDLHGGNVLVDQDGNPILIDFGRVGRMTASLDPITLEVASVLHPDSSVELGGWPSEDQARKWLDLEQYLVDCPIPEFITQCREWADEVCRGDREKDATLYSYAARQLRFPRSVEQTTVQAFLVGAVERLAAR
jgi:CheY-like chemotaxis protein